MKHFVVVRHGSYDFQRTDFEGQKRSVDFLIPEGVQGLINLGIKVQPLAEKGRIVIFSSMAPRAVQSASILLGVFGGGIMELQSAFGNTQGDEDGTPEDEDMRLISSRDDADLVIVVTHQPWTGYLATKFLKQRLSIEKRLGDLSPGKAWVIDAIKGETQQF